MPRLLTPYPLWLATGAAIGVVAGDFVFPVATHVFGAPGGDLVLGLGGAAFAAVLYEIANIRGRW